MLSTIRSLVRVIRLVAVAGLVLSLAAGAAQAKGESLSGRLLIANSLAEDHPQKQLLVRYLIDYEKKYPDDKVSTFGGHAYDALTILIAGIEKAGSTTDKEKVRDAIESLQGVAGTAGIFNFSAEDHNGLDINSFEMLTVKDGKFAIYNK